ncbi:GIY-YIG nuclease family protein [Maribacter sp. HS]
MKGYVYITTNKNKTVLYVEATDDIKRRVNKLNES